MKMKLRARHIATIEAFALITLVLVLMKEKQSNGSSHHVTEDKGFNNTPIMSNCPKLSKLFTIDPNEDSLESHLKVLATREYPRTVRPRTCQNCNNFNFTTTIHPGGVCSGNNQVDLLVLVTSVPSAVIMRLTLRKTWLQHSKLNTANVRHVFLFGGGWSKQEQAIIHSESVKYGDILQEDYKDAYYNLSLKVMSGYKWGLKFCSQAKFTLRTADDNYINIPELVKWIRTNSHKNMRAQIGHLVDFPAVHRLPNRKWFVSYQEFPEDVYPPYAMGTAFLYSMASVKEVVLAAPNVPFFPIEDAWFGMVMREINMPVIREPGFDRLLQGRLLMEMVEGQCPDNHQFLSIHLVPPAAMELLWQLCSNSS